MTKTRTVPVYVPSLKVEIVDTVVAGDIFNFGFLAKPFEPSCLSKDQLKSHTLDALLQTLELGAKAASVPVSRIGAGSPWARDLKWALS